MPRTPRTRAREKPHMDSFDELAQALARGVSRRQAFRRFAVGLAAAVVGPMLPWQVPVIAGVQRVYASGVPVSGMSVSGMSAPDAVPSIRVGANGPDVVAIQLLL